MVRTTIGEILRALSDQEVEELLQLYKIKYGVDNFHYLLIYNQLKWDKHLRDLNLGSSLNTKEWIPFQKQFYTHRNCDFREYGTYVSLHFDMIQSVSFHSWQPQLRELFECLEQTTLIDWKSGPLLTNVDELYCEKVKTLAETKGSSVQRARTCHGLILTHKEALNIREPDLPRGLKFAPLQVKHAEQIHSTWTNKKEGSLEYIRGLIKINLSLGIFQTSDDSLVGWIIQNDFAGLGFLQVLPSLQRMGLGFSLAAVLSKRIAEAEPVELSVWILTENFRSEGLLEKVGYTKSVINEWIQLNKGN